MNDGDVADVLVARLKVALSDADRLAEAAETFLRMEYQHGKIRVRADHPYEVAHAALLAALAAHDAARTKEGP